MLLDDIKHYMGNGWWLLDDICAAFPEATELEIYCLLIDDSEFERVHNHYRVK